MSESPKKTPLENLMIDALKARRLAEAEERKAAEADNPQLKLYHTDEAQPFRALEEFYLTRAWNHVALFVDGEAETPTPFAES